MKKQLLLSLSLLFTLLLNAQEVININGSLINPVGIGVKNNELFIGQVGSQTLSRVDLTQADPKPITDISTDINLVADMIFDGNQLYISTGDNNGAIYKMDITDSNNTLTPVISNMEGFPFGIAIQNNILYAALRLENKIVKIDLSESTPTATDVITNIPGFSVTDIQIYQDYLYFTTGSTVAAENTISRINLLAVNPTIETVLSDIPGPTGLELVQNILLIAAPSDNLVGMIDLSDSSPVFQTLVSVDNPWNLAIENNTLYIAQQGPDTISTFDISSLSVSDENEITSLSIYPNPSKDFIKVSNLSKALNYNITDITGKTILSSTLEVDDSIDITSLSNGIYLLQLEGNSKSFKIIKE